MKVESIKAIFTNLLFVLGVILTVIGFVRTSMFAVKVIAFDKYPLPEWEEARCVINPGPLPKFDTQDPQTKEIEERRAVEEEARCKISQETRRSNKIVEDSVSGITTFIAGVVISLIFKGFIFEKKNKD